MNPAEKKLKAETVKWLGRLETKVKHVKTTKSGSAREQMLNVRAYMKDCRHFLSQGEYIRAFEAVIYAWGIFETLERMGHCKK